MFKPLLCMLGVHDDRVMMYEYKKTQSFGAHVVKLVLHCECRRCGKLSTNRR